MSEFVPRPGDPEDQTLSALLQARTTPPLVSPRTIVRPVLMAALDEAALQPLTLVSAGPGWGKSELVRTWVRDRVEQAPVAWVSLDDDCDDPYRFWALVITALRTAAPTLRPLQALRVPGEVDESFLFQVMVALQELAEPMVLVLEDVHELRSPEALAAVDLLVGMLPAQLRLVMVTRSDPPIALHRLRLDGALSDLRQNVLAFSEAEAHELFVQHDVVLDQQELQQVMLRTEGWPAGLRLAALSLAGHVDPHERAEAIAQFAGDHRSVVDYLVAEVLGAQPEPLRRFLLETSVVERLSPDLAEAITGTAGGAEALDVLERAGAGVVALDPRRRWYRYHRLMQEMCRHRLEVEQPGAAAVLHRRASLWFAEHGEPREAVRHAALARDWTLLGRTTVNAAGPLVFGYEGRSLRALLADVPDEPTTRDPWVACARALALHDSHDRGELERRLLVGESLLLELGEEGHRAPALVLALVRASAARAAYDLAGAAHHAGEALRLSQGLTSTEVPALSRYVALAHVTLGASLAWQGQFAAAEGHLRAARALASPSVPEPESDATAVHAHAYLALVLAMQGATGEARREAQSALDVAEQAGWSDDEHLAGAHLALSLVHLHRADREAAVAALESAGRMLDEKPDVLLEIGCRLVGLRTLPSGGDQARRVQALLEVRHLVSTVPGVSFLAALEDFTLAHADLEAGRYDEVLCRLERLMGGGDVLPAYARGLQARALLLMGRPNEAMALVEALPGEVGHEVTVIETWLVLAQAQDALRNDAAALTALGRALDVAAPERLLGPFVARMPKLGPLVRRHAATVRTHPDLVALVLGQEAVPEAPTDTLTDRELSVLQLLPTMMSNAEIADELHVSINTVKAHLKSLYRKLGVSSRREAVRRGEALLAPRPS